MDNLVLITVARALGEQLAGAVLEDVHQEAAHRFRLRWRTPRGPSATIVSLLPESPWIGRALGPGLKRRPSSGGFAAELRRALTGQTLGELAKPSGDRWLRLRFGGARTLVVELAPHGANLVLLDAEGRVLGSLRRPRASRRRLEPGAPWAPPTMPRGLIDPFSAGPAEIDAAVDAAREGGEPALEAIRRRVFGVGTPGARLVLDEAAASGRSVGSVLAGRLRDLADGGLAPVIEEGEALWPWPRAATAGGADPAETAARWYEALERGRLRATRLRALRQIVAREGRRVHNALRHVEADLDGFREPDAARRHAVALLAGLSVAERVGDAVRVPDPESVDGAELLVPAAPGVALPEVAERLFARHRRALRGAERARSRLEQLQRRAAALAAIERSLREEDVDEAAALAHMREAGLPVGLESSARAARSGTRRRLPRLEGVRVYHGPGGETILAGKGGKENHRLTFRLASPEDFWLHALGVPGAHVVLRNDDRLARPEPEALRAAASIAAFHSDAASQPWVDVQWTRRKNVKKPRQAPMGTVVLKRFETVRVRPGLPDRG